MRIARRIETVDDFNALVKELRDEQGRTAADAEHDIGLTQGHIGKIENGEKSWGKRVLNITPTATWIMEYLGVTLMVVDKGTADILTAPLFQRRLSRHRRKKDRMEFPKRRDLVVRLTRSPHGQGGAQKKQG